MELDGSFIELADGRKLESIYVYRSRSTLPDDGWNSHPILRSSMDVVMQRYQDNFGTQGLADLIAQSLND